MFYILGPCIAILEKTNSSNQVTLVYDASLDDDLG